MAASAFRVLLIEDDEDDYLITRDLFAEIQLPQFQLSWVDNYEAGREAIGRNEHDLYLIDYRLGPHSGLDLLQEAVACNCAAPIILLTGIGGEQVDTAAMNAGAADYLVKGQITPALLERSIKHALQRKKIERTLRESEEQYRLLFEKNPHPMWVADGETLAFFAVNEAAIQHYGFTREEFMQRTIRDLQAGDSDPASMNPPTAKSSQPGPSSSLEGLWKHRKRDGTLIDMEITSNWISFQGKRAALILANDVTRRLALEAQLRQSQKMESLGTLAGGIAHDFNNILGIILGYAAWMPQLSQSGDQFQRGMDAISKAADRGAGLVKQILTFARRTEVSWQPVNVNSIVEELAKMLHDTFPKTIRFSLHLDSRVPYITADPSQLHQALLNLYVNARDAMPNGGELSVQTSVMHSSYLLGLFREMPESDFVCIRVSDTGVGMDENTRSRIFEPFFTTKSRDRGTGLGLAVVYGVIESHHGFIRTESQIGRGTTFHIFLPVPVGNEVRPSKLNEAHDVVPNGTETILVVEDEVLIRDLLKEMLTAKGYTVVTAEDGIDAVNTYQRHRDAVALVIVDVGLPVLSGDKALLRIKEINPGVKSILASGYLDPDLKNNLLKIGANDFLQKPYVLDELCRRVRRMLDA